MKKTLLALSLLAATSGLAHAQSSVVLSGQLDVAMGATAYMIQWPFAEPYNDLRGEFPAKDSSAPIVYSNRKVGVLRSANGGSYLQFYGVEDFNNGLSAFFKLRADFDYTGINNDPNPVFFSHTAVVGLKGENFGQLTFGRQGSASGELSLDPFGNFNLMGADTAGDAAGQVNDATLMYLTPNISGFQFGVSYDSKIFEVYDVGSKTWNSQEDAYNHFSVGLSYTGDLLSAAVTFDQLNTKANDEQNLKPARALTAGLALNFSSVEVYYRFAYAARGFDGDIGQKLYNQYYATTNSQRLTPREFVTGADMAPAPAASPLYPEVFNSAFASPPNITDLMHRYGHELGIILRLSDRLTVKWGNQFEYFHNPISGLASRATLVPKFVKGNSEAGKEAWNGKGAAPEYVYKESANSGELQVLSYVTKAAVVYRLFQRFDIYGFADYGFMKARLDTGDKNVRTDVGRTHNVYAGAGFTLYF